MLFKENMLPDDYNTNLVIIHQFVYCKIAYIYFNNLDMLSKNFITELKNENQALQLQLNDLEYMIQMREEELLYLKKTADSIAELQSRFDHNLYEFEQMQNHIGDQQQKAEGAARREIALEDEMIQTIQTETAYYELRDQFKSSKAAFDDINSQLEDMSLLYRELADLKSKVTELESNLEIVNLDNQFLKEDLEKYRFEEENQTEEN